MNFSAAISIIAENLCGMEGELPPELSEGKNFLSPRLPPPINWQVVNRSAKAVREYCCCALWARDSVPLWTQDLRPGLEYDAPPELDCGDSIPPCNRKLSPHGTH
jgi:hypothetical protein